MKKLITFPLGGLVLCSLAFSQSTTTISGHITEANSGKPLPFATVGIAGSPHGTISNTSGEFEFFFPSSKKEDTLTISYVGFQTFKKAIRDINGPLNIELKENIILLDEVEVNGEQLTAKQIMERVLEELQDNYSTNPFIIKGFFRDIRDQNNETVYLSEAAVDVQDRGFIEGKDLPKKFFLRGVRASKSRINNLLWASYLNSRNSLTLNLEYDFWLTRLKQMIERNQFTIEDIVSKNDQLFYLIRTEQLNAQTFLADKYKDMKYNLVHKYLVETETYAIHKVEVLEVPLQGKYVGIEHPYEGDTLFYSKKGWNQVIEFEEYLGKMYLKYNDVSYAFDIVDEKNDKVYLDMAYQFIFITTEIVTDQKVQPEGIKMNRNKPLLLQAKYDASFWQNPSNAKLVPLTQKQIQGLEKIEPLEEQFQAKKSRLKKNSN